MIPSAWITEWRAHAPWSTDAQIEQDLIISRALVEIFSRPKVADSLAFRGGTALYKLHLRPAARYSEDIDLVQTRAEPIGHTLDELREALDPWLGTPQRKLKDGRVSLLYRFFSEDSSPIPLRLKIEINSREHFSVYGLELHSFEVQSRWFQGQTKIVTYTLDELIGTKVRALYQRKKGRDLFDLDLALKHTSLDPNRVIHAFQRYMAEEDAHITRAIFEQNLAEKLRDNRFLSDMGPLLAHGYTWNLEQAAEQVCESLLSKLPGEPWKGSI